MKRKIRILLNTLLRLVGYRISPLRDDNALYNNFCNLAKVFEHTRNSLDTAYPVEANEQRVELLGRLLGTPPSEAYFIIEALAQTDNLAGDVCEFGVAQGETSALIANEIRSTTKKLHLFDSFQGLPKPGEKDALKDDIFSLGTMGAYFGAMSFAEDCVKYRLEDIKFPVDRYVIHKGFIEESLNNGINLPELVSCAYIDFDFYDPIKATLNYLHRVSNKGAIFIVDDYDYFSTGAKLAVDEFVAQVNSKEKSYEILIPDKCYGCFAVLRRVK